MPFLNQIDSRTDSQDFYFKVLFSVYLISFAWLSYPYTDELLGMEAVFPGFAINLYSYFPATWVMALTPSVKFIFPIIGLLAFLIPLKRTQRVAAFSIFFLLIWLYNRNPLANSPERALVLCLLFFLAVEGRIKFYYLREIAWLLLCVSYGFAAFVKLLYGDMAWSTGDALKDIFLYAEVRGDLGIWLGQNAPAFLLKGASYLALVIQILAPLSLLLKRARRFYWWLPATLMQLGILFTLELYQISIGMLLFHLYLWERDWVNFFKKAKPGKSVR